MIEHFRSVNLPYVVGSTAEGATKVDAQIRAMGITVKRISAKSAGIAAGSITRLAGSNQYKTARVIAEWACGQLKNGTGGGSGLYQYASVRFQPSVKLSADKLAVARADDNNIGWKDALAGAALCGKNRAVVLLADAANDAQAVAFVKANKAQIYSGYVLGGTLAVPKATMDRLVQASE